MFRFSVFAWLKSGQQQCREPRQHRRQGKRSLPRQRAVLRAAAAARSVSRPASSDGHGIGGGVYNLGMFTADVFTLIKKNHASTSKDIFG